MIYNGKIVDAGGLPIPGASLAIKTDAGQLVTFLPVTSGNWSIDDSVDDGLLAPGMAAVFSAPGYFPYTISTVTIPPSFTVSLTKQTSKIPLIVVGAGLGAGLLYFATRKKGRRVGGGEATAPGTSNSEGWILPVAVLGLGAFIVYELFGKPDPKAKESGQLADAAVGKLKALINSGISPTMSSASAEAAASAIVEAANNCGTDEDAIFGVFLSLNNAADFWQLVATYGVRNYHGCFTDNWLSDTPFNLVQTITGEMSASDRDTLNDRLRDIGVTDFNF